MDRIRDIAPPKGAASRRSYTIQEGGGAEAEQGEGRRARSTWKGSGCGPRQSRQSRKPGQSGRNWSPPGRSGRNWSPPGRSGRDWSPPGRSGRDWSPPGRSGRSPRQSRRPPDPSRIPPRRSRGPPDLSRRPPRRSRSDGRPTQGRRLSRKPWQSLRSRENRDRQHREIRDRQHRQCIHGLRGHGREHKTINKV